MSVQNNSYWNAVMTALADVWNMYNITTYSGLLLQYQLQNLKKYTLRRKLTLSIWELFKKSIFIQ